MGDELRCHVRWAIRKDLNRMIEIDKTSFLNTWTEKEFMCQLRNKNCIGRVAELDNGFIAGFTILSLHKHFVELVRGAVDYELRRCGIGTELLHDAARRLNRNNRRAILCDVDDSWLSGQLFLRDNGFLCVERHAFGPDDGETYRFVYERDRPQKKKSSETVDNAW